jgi:hypothetical protein
MNRNSSADRKVCLDAHLKHDEMGPYMICHVSGVRFNPATTRWRADHIRRHAHGGERSGKNLWPILESVDAGPGGKAAQDTREVAKGKRMRSKHFGAKGPKRGFRGWRKMNGEVVWNG